MGKFKILIAVIAMSFAIQPLNAQNSTNQDEVNHLDLRSREFRPGQLLVKFKSSSNVVVRKTLKGTSVANISDINTVMAKFGAEKLEKLMPLTGKQVVRKVLKTYSDRDIEVSDMSTLYLMKLDSTNQSNVREAITALKALPEVEYAEPNYLVYTMAANDSAEYTKEPLYSQQWGPAAINLPQLWNKPFITTKRPVIAILDTGVDTEHPDLKANIWTNPAESTGTESADDDKNGFIDDVHGWDFVNQTGKIRDNNGHGTHCAGIAGAVGNNGIGITGANPDAYIMPVTVMQSDGTGDVATIIKGIDYAAANGADVISMSFGGYSYSIAEEQALAKAYSSSVLVAAAGNDCLPINPVKCKICYEKGKPMFPAAFTFVLGVEASGNDGGRATFSNYDDDGPVFFNPQFFSEEQMYNYELRAPGVGIYSTYPNGNYKALNGTSMACPLAAGAISRLLQTKSYTNKEILFGDLIRTRTDNMDVLAAYNITDADRKPTLDVVTYNTVDSLGDKDGRWDAGETIDLYPVLRNEWGQANNIKVWLEPGENEDPNIVEFLTDKVSFGKPLSSYAKATSANPIRIKVNKNCVDGRHINLRFKAVCDNITDTLNYEFTAVVENGVEIGGMIDHDMTLYPNVHYIVTNSLAIPTGVTLTIKPGAVLKFKNNTSILCDGKIKASGTKDSLIVFTKADLTQDFVNNLKFQNIEPLEYISIQDLYIGEENYSNVFCVTGNFKNSNISNCSLDEATFSSCNFEKCTFVSNQTRETEVYGYWRNSSFNKCNFIGDKINNTYVAENYDNRYLGANNIYNNLYNGKIVSLGLSRFSSGVINYETNLPSYYGSSREDIVRKGIYDIEHGCGYSKFNLSNMLTQPNPEAHGVVWKVLVDGYDAQDEFEQMPPIGVGKHKVEVWYSKKISENIVPTIAMGIRPPYTQTSIGEDGSWRTETTHFNNNGSITDVDVSVYTAYITITGKMAIDGLNRIYVGGGEDLEHFEIPLENYRFNVEVAAAGSMSTGFMAEPGLGKVRLEWGEQDGKVDDILGYNMYRYTIVNDSTQSDTIRINSELINDTTFTDFNVVPGKSYCYFYKIMRTDLSENSPSKVVAATPLTASKGDSNGSMSVDVADIVTDIAYLTNQDPQPFIFDAADVNKDSNINILDVVGTVNIIVNPNSSSQGITSQSTASYYVKNGILYVETPVALGGVQFALNAPKGTSVTPMDDLNGFEQIGNWTNDNEYMFMAYSMSGKTITPGTHALLNIGDASVGKVVLSTVSGSNVNVENGGTVGIETVKTVTKSVPYPNPFIQSVTIPYTISQTGKHQVRITVYDMLGHIQTIYNTVKDAGNHSYVWNATNGANYYIATLYIDGKEIDAFKLIRSNK
jgi:subtilisin family serine protease